MLAVAGELSAAAASAADAAVAFFPLFFCFRLFLSFSSRCVLHDSRATVSLPAESSQCQ